MDRYSRQTLFSPIGKSGQSKLLSSRVAIVGLGALGSVLANHMVRSGVGYIRIIDRDFVETSNLQRQMLYDETDVEQFLPKAVAAFNKLNLINSSVKIDPVVADINSGNAELLLDGFDLVLDGTDNFLTRFLINDVCVKSNTPWIYGGAVSSNGMFSVIRPHITPCFCCLYEYSSDLNHGETCDTSGVLGPLVNIVASYQATEALKILTANEHMLSSFIQHLDIWHNEVEHFEIGPINPECPCCGKHQFNFLDPAKTYDNFTSLCGRNTIQITPSNPKKVNLEALSNKIGHLGTVDYNKFLVKLHVDSYQLIYFEDGRVLVQGTSDLSQAKSLYSKYVGM
ncbi:MULTISPECIES: ThiF family adenylyltransferase [unclassified Paenibacillus]|uniref:ThiF family adenylyltransferase n=1 Tax=unclassified Paenibacillus TaxID=185978 RepID=UPI000FBAF5E4|nr:MULTISPECIES: ThiF family adenylyltransferase [unclassified Paenibacillus]MBP1172912.1 adenylyltransferase/sulfurtransferase [Paenibacillus sp. PvR133]MBP1310359.1 adenylyltransferase/sulfurtransferase [Paenibacillus sp. 1182]